MRYLKLFALLMAFILTSKSEAQINVPNMELDEERHLCPYYDQMVPVVRYGKWHLLNTIDTTLIDNVKYDSIVPGGIGEGYFIFREKEKWGLVKDSGDVLIPNEYANYYIKNGVLVFYSPHKAIAFNCQLSNLSKEYDKIDVLNYSIRVKRDDKYGLIDMEFHELISTKYEMTGEWQQFYMVIKNEKISLLSHDLDEVIPLEYEDVIVNPGYKVIRARKGDSWKYFNFNGQVLNDSVYLLPYGYYKSMRPEGEYLYRINDNSLVMSSSHFIYPVGEDRISLSDGEKCKLVSPVGEEFFDFTYDNIIPVFITDYTRGRYLIVENDGKQGVVDWNGNLVLPVEYHTAFYPVVANNQTYFQVVNEGKMGLINSEGEIEIPIEYENIIMKSSYAYLLKYGKFGLYSFIQNKKYLKTEFDDIEVKSDFYTVGHKRGMSYVYHQSNMISSYFDEIFVHDYIMKLYQGKNLTVYESEDGALNKFKYNLPDVKVRDEKEKRNSLKYYAFDPHRLHIDVKNGLWSSVSKRNGKPLYESEFFYFLPTRYSNSYVVNEKRDENIHTSIYGFPITADRYVEYVGKTKISRQDFVFLGISKYSSYRISGVSTDSDLATRKSGEFTTPSQIVDIPIYVEDGLKGFRKAINKGKITLSKEEGFTNFKKFYLEYETNDNYFPSSIDGYKKLLEDSLQLNINIPQPWSHKKMSYTGYASFWNSKTRYDYIDDFTYNPKIFAKSNRFGLINDSARYILPPTYDSLMRIDYTHYLAGKKVENYWIYNYEKDSVTASLDNIFKSDDHFIVTMKDTFFEVYNNEGYYVLSTPKEPFTLGNQFVWIKEEEGIQKLFNTNGEVVLQTTYEIKDVFYDQVIHTKEGSNSILRSTNGELVLPDCKNCKIEAWGDCLLLVEKRDEYLIINCKDYSSKTYAKDKTEILNSGHLLVQQFFKSRFLNPVNDEYISERFKLRRVYDEMVISENGSFYDVYDLNGKQVQNYLSRLGQTFNKFYTAIEGEQSKWTLFHVEKGRIDSISDSDFIFQGDSVYVRQNQKLLAVSAIHEEETNHDDDTLQVVRHNFRKQLIHKNTKEKIVDWEAYEIIPHQKFALISKEPIVGIIDEKGKVILPVHFSHINVSNRFFLTQQDGLYEYYNKEGDHLLWINQFMKYE